MKTKIIVFMEGGLVQCVMTDTEADVTILDHDIDGIEPEQINMIEGEETYIYRFRGHEQDSVRVNKILKEIEEVWSEES